ncbi:MAG: NAD(P)/FAD-dependent oxidoreductase [Chitinophagaceae bacterium]|nr:NAD(P)/FAD-dependent oxidoreductase [Chitinophagaceae bacterium]
MSKQLIVIGGGAAGFFCAVNVAKARPDLAVRILEKQSKVLQKVKVSGGGRCNVTNACFQPAELLKKYPRGKNFLKKAFGYFSTKDTIAWFQQRGVALITEPDGRMFPASHSSQTIIDCLLREATAYGVHLNLNTEVVQVEKKADQFYISRKNADVIIADYLVVASGGFPKSAQYEWLTSLGHTIEQPSPSLFTFNTPSSSLKELMGVVVEHAIVKIEGSKLTEQGPVLITHWGLSGPAILRLSAWGARELQQSSYSFKVIVNWLGQPESDIRERWSTIRIRQGANRLDAKNPFGLPNRLWDYLLKECAISAQIKWSELPSKEQNKLIHILTTHLIAVEGKTTFKEEFVTCGGISLAEIEPSTMESKLVKGLYFGGEIMDVDGITGGFNFQHAWTSGYIAASSIAKC